MSILITIKGIRNKKYNTSEYIKLKLYLLGLTGMAVIKRELYIINNLSIKALIGIDIIKPEGIIIDLNKDIIKVGTYEDIEVSIVINVRG